MVRALRYGIVLALLVAACGTGTRKSAPVADADNQAIMNKIDAYRHCLSDHSERYFRIADLYRQGFRDAAPTPASAVVLPLPADPTECVEGVEAARSLQPAMPEVEAAAGRFARALQATRSLVVAARAVYEPGPTHDPGAGAVLHPQLLAAFDEIDVAQAELFDHVFRLNREVHLTQFKQRQSRDGDSIDTRAEAMMLEAEGIVSAARVRWDQLERLDIVGFETQQARFERAFDFLVQFALDHDKEAAQFDRFDAIQHHARQLEIASRQLARRARDKVPYSDAERLMIAAGNEAAVPGTPGALVHTYNQLQALY